MVTIARQALALCKCGTSGQGQELCGVDLTNSEAIRSETPIKNQTLPERGGGGGGQPQFINFGKIYRIFKSGDTQEWILDTTISRGPGVSIPDVQDK